KIKFSVVTVIQNFCLQFERSFVKSTDLEGSGSGSFGFDGIELDEEDLEDSNESPDSNEYLANETRPHCVMFGKCGSDMNCKTQDPPKSLQETDENFLKTVCPELVDEFSGEFCCDKSQILDLKNNLALIQKTKNCSSCYQNSRNFFCHVTCSPVQSSFMSVNSTTTEGLVPGKEAVIKMEVTIANGYAQEVFKSCQNASITNDAGEEVSASELLCGLRRPGICTSERLWENLGAIYGNSTSLEFIFKYWDKDSYGDISNEQDWDEGMQPFTNVISYAECPKNLDAPDDPETTSTVLLGTNLTVKASSGCSVFSQFRVCAEMSGRVLIWGVALFSSLVYLKYSCNI
ncbi:unnamed protein product, partial [Allacma fusca]